MTRTLDPRVVEIFERVVASHGTERRRLVEQACAGDGDLAREVTSLLEAHDGAGDFLLEPAAVARREPFDVDGRFRVLRHIGSGSMGTVYLAEQIAPVRRVVALKLLRPGRGSEEALRRFELERQAVARMNHAGIARLFDSGATDEGQPWFAMEHVAGEPITAFCAARELSLFARVRLVIAICRAAHHAHQSGVIHRDLKPGNVLVAEEDGKPAPKIIDFGVAKALSPIEGAAFQTNHGELVGTLEYMSPEQALGAEGSIDVRTDVYALGAILYELITGEHPLPIRAARDQGLASMLNVLRDAEPRPPSACLDAQAAASTDAVERASLRAAARRVRGDLDWIVLTAVEKNRARRYESAAALAADLEHFLAREPVSVAPPGRGYRIAKFASRHRAPLLVAAAIFVSLVAGLAAALAQAREASQQRDLALRSAQQARDALSQLSFNAASSVHKTDEQLADVLGATRARLEFAKWGLDCLERTQDYPELRDTIDMPLGYAMQRIGEARLACGEIENALAWFERAFEHRVRDVAEHPNVTTRRTLAVGHWKLGDALRELGEIERAEEHYRTALSGLEALESEGLFQDVSAHIYIGMAQRRVADADADAARDDAALEGYARAMQRFERALAGPLEVDWPTRHEQVLALCGRASLLARKQRTAEARQALDAAFPLLDVEAVRAGPSNIWERSHRALALLERAELALLDGDGDSAIADARAAVELTAPMAAGDRDNVTVLLLCAHAQSELARALTRAGRGEDAAAVLGGAVPALEGIVRKEPHFARARCELALACRRMALAYAARPSDVSESWKRRGSELVAELEREQRLAPSDGARLAEAR